MAKVHKLHIFSTSIFGLIFTINICVGQNSSYIGDCDYYAVDEKINDNITFICGDSSAHASKFFTPDVTSTCRNQESSLYKERIQP